LIVFQHDSDLGNAPSHLLFDMVKVARKPDVIVPRSFSDYSVDFDPKKVPAGVTAIQKL
jgi:CRISPR-associated protein Csd2